MKKIIRLSEIRKNIETPCPYGLPIPFGCKYAGEHINKLAPIDILGKDSTTEEKEQITEANIRLLSWKLMNSSEEPKKCIYAAAIMEEQDGVECNYDDTAPGVGRADLSSAPNYSQVFMGNNINGLMTFPAGYYGDYNTSRNLFYGIYSLQGSKLQESIEKLANNVE